MLIRPSKRSASPRARRRLRGRRPWQRWVAAVTAALLAVPLAGGGAGAEAPRLAKVFMVRLQAAPDVSPLIPRRLTDQLRAELGTAESIDLLPDEEAATDVQVGARAVDRREEAEQAVAAGRVALARNAFDQAAEHLRRALKAFDESAAVLEDVKPVAYAYVLLGIVEGRRRRDHECRSAFARALTLQPTVRPNLAGQPRRVRRLFDHVRKARKGKAGGVTVQSQPEGVDVFVDGRPYGQTPAVIDLAPGGHFIRAAKAGYAPAGRFVEVRSGTSTQLQLRLRAKSAAAAAGGDAARAAFHGEVIKRVRSGVIDVRLKDVARSFTERLQAAFLVVGYVSRGADGYLLRVYLYRRAGNNLVELDAARFDSELVNLNTGLYQLAEQITQAVKRYPEQRDITTAQLNLGVGGGGGGRHGRGTIDTGPVAVTGETGPQIDIAPPVWRTWWFWTLIGVVVVGSGAAGLVLYLQPKHDGLYGGPVTLR